MFTKYPDVVTVEQLCAMLNVGKNTAYDLIKQDIIRSVKIGRTYKIPKINVIKYLKTAK